MPPRPINTGAAHSLSKSSSSSSNSHSSTIKLSAAVPVHGRTVIYKSPSYDLKSHNKNTDENDDGGDDDNDQDAADESASEARRRTAAATLIRSFDDVTKTNNNNNKIIILNNNNNNNNNTTTNTVVEHQQHKHVIRTEATVQLQTGQHHRNNSLDENSHRLEIRQLSPIAKPRLNAPSKKNAAPLRPHSIVVNNDENHIPLNVAAAVKSDPRQPDNNYNRIEIKNQTPHHVHLELKNNLKNVSALDAAPFGSTVAEKLFTEIIINSQLAAVDESAAARLQQPQYQTKLEHCIAVRTPSPPLLYSSSSTTPPPPSDGDATTTTIAAVGCAATAAASEKKVTFHEMLISELTEMHKDDDSKVVAAPEELTVRSKGSNQRCRRYSSSCSADSSPNGTQRARIRTSDWVEVGDNGKEVLLTSCQISLEDSGLEDEEQRLDDVSSGVGDSWDSVKDTNNDDR